MVIETKHMIVTSDDNVNYVYIYRSITFHPKKILSLSALQELGKLGAKTELVDVGGQILADGLEIALPPILLASIGNNPQKKTLLVYGHMDVQPALKVTTIQKHI